MTLSNFDWTDKDSIRWFILLPSGHEGPYSFHKLENLWNQKKLVPEVKVWAEGLPEPLTFRALLAKKNVPVQSEFEPIPPPLPEDDEIPPLPDVTEDFSNGPPPVPEMSPEARSIPIWGVVVVLSFFLLVITLIGLAKGREKFSIGRLSKMGPQIHERIMSENSFAGWDKEIFFKEYMPLDHSEIWLVTSSYQECEVETTFTSVDNKLLSMMDEKVSFRSKGRLDDHVTELNTFEFTQGNRIVPGLYEMDVKATHCKWNGLYPLMMNAFRDPGPEYMARMKVVIFSRGAEEFNRTLQTILSKKDEIARREKDENYFFWQDLQQKLQTLEAISLQVEQHLLDFLDKNPADFKNNLKPMVDSYTRNFGSFLTSFVVENDQYFKTLDVRGASMKRNYELMVRLTSKKIGLESMKFIEEFQSIKKSPNQKEINALSGKVKKVFSSLKQEISQKLAQISEDQEK